MEAISAALACSADASGVGTGAVFCSSGAVRRSRSTPTATATTTSKPTPAAMRPPEPDVDGAEMTSTFHTVRSVLPAGSNTVMTTARSPAESKVSCTSSPSRSASSSGTPLPSESESGLMSQCTRSVSAASTGSSTLTRTTVEAPSSTEAGNALTEVAERRGAVRSTTTTRRSRTSLFPLGSVTVKRTVCSPESDQDATMVVFWPLGAPSMAHAQTSTRWSSVEGAHERRSTASGSKRYPSSTGCSAPKEEIFAVGATTSVTDT